MKKSTEWQFEPSVDLFVYILTVLIELNYTC